VCVCVCVRACVRACVRVLGVKFLENRHMGSVATLCVCVCCVVYKIANQVCCHSIVNNSYKVFCPFKN